MVDKSQFTAAYLRSMVDYDPSSGAFFWKRRPVAHFQDEGKRTAIHTCANWNTRFAGKRAGGINQHIGYRVIRIAGANYYEHRLVWLWVTGNWPDDRIDHANRDKSDNRWSNLRAATHAKNLANSPARKDSRSGVKGVRFDKRSRKWVARIKHTHLGAFSPIEDASAAYRKAAIDLYGEFASS